jgi:hypothetical protein
LIDTPVQLKEILEVNYSMDTEEAKKGEEINMEPWVDVKI